MTITTTFGRVGWGILAGLCAIVAKYLGQDHQFVQAWIHADDYLSCQKLMWGYLILALFLCFLGAVFAAASGEGHPMKLIAIAIAAPAIVTTYTGGNSPDKQAALPSLISEARAEGVGSTQSPSLRSTIVDGVWMVLGYGKEMPKYRVVAGSYLNKTEADIAAGKIRRVIPDTPVWVGESRAGNEHFPVIVGSYEDYLVAQRLKDAVATKAGIPDAFLSPKKQQ